MRQSNHILRNHNHNLHSRNHRNHSHNHRRHHNHSCRNRNYGRRRRRHNSSNKEVTNRHCSLSSCWRRSRHSNNHWDLRQIHRRVLNRWDLRLSLCELAVERRQIRIQIRVSRHRILRWNLNWRSLNLTGDVSCVWRRRFGRHN